MSYRGRSSSGYRNNRRGRSGFGESSKHKSVKEIQLEHNGALAYFPDKQANFLGSCDHFRQTVEGEAQWQVMMQTKKPISERDFLRKVDVRDVLDEGETWKEYKEVAKREGSPLEFYESSNRLVFFQTAGFEFIWKLT